MTFFQHLPSSVLQAGAIFLSIIIEALPFVLIGSIISGIIEVYITPERVYRFLPKNKFGRIFFGTFIGFIFPSCECGIVPIINRFLEKKVPSYTAVPFLGDSTCHQSHRSLCDLLSLWEFCQDGPLPRPWFPTGRNGARDLSWFYSDRFDPKRTS